MEAEPRVEVIDGRYEVGPVIGRGAMGEVRRGRDLRLDRDVAIKYLRADLAADPEVRSRFEDEARSAASLSHPAIVAVFDSGEYDGVPFLVMECLPGRTLADELADGPVAADRLRQIAIDIAGALDAAHQRGVVHRDVKPGNILLTESGSTKLADFGIAKSTESLDHTATGMIFGTPAYLAPERLAGERATASSDIYSLGVVLYEALSGEKLFQGETPIAVAHAIHTTTPPPIARRFPGVDPALAGAIDGAMAKDPAARPPSAQALLAFLNRPAPSPTRPMPATAPADTQAVTRYLAAESGSTKARPLAPMARPIIVVGGVVAAVVALLLVVSLLDDDGTTASPTTTLVPISPSGELPQPLDDAIGQLEESVQP